MKYKIQIEPEVQLDIQDAVAWYNSQQKGLGRKFYNEVKKHLKHLKINPYFQIRYENVRCLPIRKFPYMIHFTVNELDKIIKVHAVTGTSRDPNIWKQRIK